MSWFGKKQDLPKAELRTPEGMAVFASASSGNIPPLPLAGDRLEVVVPWYARLRMPRLFQCGHDGPASFRLHTYGEQTKDLGGLDKCPDCQLAFYKKHLIRCAMCRLYIQPGDGVALYDYESLGLHLDIATRVGSAVIGCLRMACCPSGGFFAGNWSVDGFKPRYQEKRTVAEDVAASIREENKEDMEGEEWKS